MSEVQTNNITSELVRLRAQVFARSPLRWRLWTRLTRLMDSSAGQQVLEMSGDDALSVALRNRGGGVEWTSLAASEEQAALLSAAGMSRVQVATQIPLPFEDAAFDAAVVSGTLEYVEKPTEWMAELHRVLRPKTRLILHVRRKRKTPVGLFRRLAGLMDPSRPVLHDGFTPAELFDVLKDGFDVQETVGFGRFFTEFTQLLAELFSGTLPASCEPAALNERQMRRAAVVYAVFKPLFWVAAVLDAPCFFLPYHHMVVRAKRRMLWVPRVTPRLRDGRSIAEAALGSKIGTSLE